MPLPQITVEVEFVDGVWTDVTGDVDMDAGFEVPVGRTSPTQAPQPGQVTFTLRNPDGRYTPATATLADGSPNPNYPNVVQRRRIRYSNTAMGTRHVGYIQSWLPTTNGFPGSSRSVVTVIDRLGPLSKITLDSPLRQEYFADSPSVFWPLTEPSGSTSAADQSGNNGPSLSIAGTAHDALAFGETGPGHGDGTGVKFSPTDNNLGQYLKGSALTSVAMDAFTMEAWVNLGITVPSWATGAVSQVVMDADSRHGTLHAVLKIVNGRAAYSDHVSEVVTHRDLTDTKWHHLVAFRSAAGDPVTLWVDGTHRGSTTSSTPTHSAVVFAVGDHAQGDRRLRGNIGYVAIYDHALSADRIRAHYAAGKGFAGDRTDERIARFLTAAGLTSADWDLDVGRATVGTYPQAGKDVVSACQDMAVTEGGGAVFYDRAGVLTFRSRDFRVPGDPVLTVEAEQDSSADGYQPALDDANLANQSTVSRSSESGTENELVAKDQPSIDRDGQSDQDATSYTQTDQDALNLAQWIVATGRKPGFRLPAVTADMLTGENDVAADVGAVEIGSLVRLSTLPAGQAPASFLDVYVEGWRERVAKGVWSWTADASPADNPPQFMWDDSDDLYSRWGCDGMTLHADVNDTVTTLVVDTDTDLPTFTLDSGAYPLDVTVGPVDGAEQIRLNTPPAGATSPQTFTGVTRAVNGTTATPHTAGDAIELAPAPAWTL